MNKSILMLLCLFASVAAFGQVKFGFKASTNYCTVSDMDPNYKGRIGTSVGVLSKMNLGKKFMVQPELLYTIKGFQFPKTNFNGSGAVSLGYLSLPILAGYRTTNKLTVVAGPELNYMLMASSRFDGRSYDIISNYTRFELGAAVGASYIEAKGFGIELRYSYGVSKLSKTVIVTDPQGNEINRRRIGNNHSIQLGILYVLQYGTQLRPSRTVYFEGIPKHHLCLPDRPDCIRS